MKNKQLVPQLRFSEFEEKWFELNFIDLIIKANQGVNTTTEKVKYSENGIQVVRSNNIGNNTLDMSNVKYVTEDTYARINKNCKPQIGDILYCNIGSDLGSATLFNLNEEILINWNVFRIRTNNKIVNNSFLTQYLNKIKYQIRKYATESTMPFISSKAFKFIKFDLPSLPEQQKIASFLTDVDDKITKLTKKKTLFEQYKKGVMQKIFNQELRFIDDDGNNFADWEEKKLGDLGNTLNGLTGKTKENFGSGKPYIQYKQIFDSSKINIANCGLVDITITDKQTKVEYGDVFFTTSSETPNEIGTASVLLDNVKEMYLNSFCFGFRVNQLVLYPSFSQFLFRSIDFRKKMIPLAQGSTRYNISKSAFVKLKVSLPSIKEQTKIANFLSDIDLKIEALNTKIENSKAFKKGLLQKMFV